MKIFNTTMSLAIYLIVMLIPILSSEAVYAKTLVNRLGVGYKNQFSIDMPAIAAQYYPTPDIALSGALGLDTEKNHSKFGFMTRVNQVIFREDSLNFYMGAGLGFVSQEINSKTTSGFELQGFIGAEYFFSGLNSLGFSFEAGVGVTSIDDSVRFRTFGDHPLRAGIIFYF